ncbi:MarR family winged helix-turn-helix transcriptional regulator [Paenibacillus caui]|uniref:MarR family winged helix-turn-helix transcriptional regulator n=1 Tax=Paenibacillus caui TaxID=2873927 RepID=UPI001CA97EC3|nr:MarR family transcriptional regulator [Paenibacillus caui]
MMKKIEAIRYMILALEREGSRKFQEIVKSIGVTGPQAEVIRVLDEFGPLSLKELGTLLICEGGSPSRLVDSVVKEGYVTRSTSESDRRAVTLMLSEKGKQKSLEISQSEKLMYQTLSDQIPSDYINQLYDAMTLILKHHAAGAPLINRKLIE